MEDGHNISIHPPNLSARVPLPPRIPLSTYRLQFNPAFTFRDAACLVPYLSRLGITDCYSSPYLKAAQGSTHGYDVTDPSMLNPELGNEDDYQTFVQALKDHDMGQILDVVPNHMGIAASGNSWWQDVLENGPASHYANLFDIDWTPVKPELQHTVLLPILGDQYGIVLENQEIRLEYQDGHFFFSYFENRFPLDPSTWPIILNLRLEELLHHLDDVDPLLQEFQSIITALIHLPTRTETDPERIAVRYREKDVIGRRLASLMEESPILLNHLRQSLTLINGEKGNSASFDTLDTLVSDQAYRLAYWRVAAEEINYRRFFDINELAAIRMERPGVFEEVHQRIFSLLSSGAVTGLRIDHVDGLYDPQAYLNEWQQWGREHLALPPDPQGRVLYLVVEKILGTGERVHPDWPVHGTTGYTFLTHLNQLFVKESHQRALEQVYSRFTKQALDYEDLIYHCKQLIMTSSMSGEINALAHQLNVLSEQNRRSRDFTLNSLTHAIREIIACFPVYRTYIGPNPNDAILDRDRAYIRLAVARAKRRNPALSTLVFDFIRDLLLTSHQEDALLPWETTRPFVMSFQQTTSPVTAKGVEDTAFYIFNRLTTLNEVGGEPQQFGLSPNVFHHMMEDRAHHWPSAMSATSTHDTKRSEDVRARISVLSEIPTEWRQHLRTWRRLNKKARKRLDGKAVPSRNEEYFIYQSILGIWPLEATNDKIPSSLLPRMHEYMVKALREAKIHSSWLNPDEEYERGVLTFVTKILSPKPQNLFLDDFLPFQRRLARYGVYNSLSQLLIKTLAPGVPDFFQGMELWCWHLVDPDNRQPVDFQLRQQHLERLLLRQESETPQELAHSLLSHPEDGLVKMFLTYQALQFRKNHPHLVQLGSYTPLEALGPQKEHVFAFLRQDQEYSCITITPRFVSSLIPEPTTLPIGGDVWGDTWLNLPPSFFDHPLRNVLTGEIVTPQNRSDMVGLPLEAVFQTWPFALLEPNL